MHLVLPIKDFDINGIFFLDKTKNNILNGGDFYRLLYSTKNVTLNGIFLLISDKREPNSKRKTTQLASQSSILYY